jgi:hypothetical protein
MAINVLPQNPFSDRNSRLLSQLESMMVVIFGTAGPRYCTALFVLLVMFMGESNGAETINAPVPIRIGWQIPAATQAQIAQVLKQTNLLKDRKGAIPISGLSVHTC